MWIDIGLCLTIAQFRMQDKHAAASISTYGQAHRSINPLAGMERTRAVKELILWMYRLFTLQDCEIRTFYQMLNAQKIKL